MTETFNYPEPEYLDCVEAPDGHGCQMWSGEGPSPCDNEAEYLVVYDGTMYDGVTTPRNVLACRECFVPAEDRTGGNAEIEPPAVTVGDRVTLCDKHDGDAEYVEGVVATAHTARTIDIVYRKESRREHGGGGKFERDHHTDTYQFVTSAVYMADAHGWLKGWDDA